VSSVDSNKSGSLIIALPFDLNSTKTGTTTALTSSVAAGNIVKFEAKSSNGGEIAAKTDLNASTLGLTGTTAIATTGNVVNIKIGAILTALTTPADTNLSSSSVTGFSLNGITDVQVYMTSAGTTGVTDDGLNSLPLAKGAFTDFTGAISASEALKILNLSTMDFRGTTTTPNNAPIVTTLDGNTTGSTVRWDYTNAAPVVVNPFTVAVTSDAGELNNSVTISGLPSWVTVTSATKTSQVTANSVDFNLSVDRNLTLNDTNVTTAKFKVTDEFGKANALDGNLSFFFNAYPVISVLTDANSSVTNFTKVSATSYKADLNTSKAAVSSVIFKLVNLMGEANSTVSFGSELNTTIARVAAVAGVTGEGNITIGGDSNGTTTTCGDFNITINEANGALSNIIFELNASL
jgi:hypothetical protein